MLYAVKHRLGVSLVHARSPKSAEKFIGKEFGERVEPIEATHDEKSIAWAKGFGAFEYNKREKI